jgi:hypothetical protein
MAKGASKSATKFLEDQEDAGEYRRAGIRLDEGGTPGTGDPVEVAPMGDG